MRYRRFGRTELAMPVFTCGGMRYQHKWSDVEPSEIPRRNQENLEATIYRAVELGINHIETARGYGTSEMQLGWVLPKLDRDRIIVQTKVAPFATQQEFFQTFERSLDYLQLEYVDLLSLHGINNRQLLDWSLGKGGSLEAARQLQREGRARHIGFSTHATCDLILEAVRSDGFDYMNVHWYFVNDLNWSAVEEAHRRDMGVFIISPNDKGGKLYEPPPKMVELCFPHSPMVFNDLYCLARSQVHTLSLGAACPSDFDEHIEALKHYDRIDEVVPPVESRLRQEMRRVLGEDWCRDWRRGLPEYTEIPGEVNVVEILRLWTYAKSLDLVEWGKMRYNLMGNADHWFPGEHVGKLRPGILKPVLSDSPFADRIEATLHQAHSLLVEAPQTRLSQG